MRSTPSMRPGHIACLVASHAPNSEYGRRKSPVWLGTPNHTAARCQTGSTRHPCRNATADTDVGDAVGDCDVGQARSQSERIVSDAGNAVANRDAGQAAVRERIITDAGHAVGDRDTGYAAPIEC